MSIKELIEILKKFDEDLIIVTGYYGDSNILRVELDHAGRFDSFGRYIEGSPPCVRIVVDE